MKAIVEDQPCGYVTKIEVKNENGKAVVSVESECDSVQRYGDNLSPLGVKDVLAKIPENPVYRLADIRHSTCIVPWMILKLAEIELGLNVEKFFEFEIEK